VRRRHPTVPIGRFDSTSCGLASYKPLGRCQWDFVSRTLAAAAGGFVRPELVELTAAGIRASMDAPAYYRFREAVLDTNVSGLMSLIGTPTCSWPWDGNQSHNSA
jgi:hypothetical protein